MARWLVLGMLATLATPALALGPNGAPIDTSDYTIDFYEGPILAGSRIIGLAGSFAPLAEGVVGYAVNPASVAMRVPWSHTWVDWELDGSLTLPSSITNTDFDNNGTAGFARNAAAFATLGAGMQLGAWGIGANFDLSSFQLAARETSGAGLDVSLIRVNVVGGYAPFDGQLVFGLGIGVRAIDLSLASSDDGDASLASVDGIDVTLGAVWAPVSLPIRMGASVRLPIPNDDSGAPEGVTADANGNYVAAGYYLPRHVAAPLEINGAIALQLLRPLNVRWQNPHVGLRPPATQKQLPSQPPASELEAPLPSAHELGGKLLVSAALKVTLATENGLGMESFLRQVVERSGQRASFSPRLGLESEPWPGWVIVRGGTYVEPTRFEASTARLHGTAGLDIHIPLLWNMFGLLDDDTTFRVGGAVDGAARYFGWTFSLGIWR
jgi:hypothetical protein